MILAERIHKAATDARARIAVLNGAKHRGKGYPNPEKIRKVITDHLLRDAIKLAIAEDVMANPRFYGKDVADEYRQRVKDYLGEEVEL